MSCDARAWTSYPGALQATQAPVRGVLRVFECYVPDLHELPPCASSPATFHFSATMHFVPPTHIMLYCRRRAGCWMRGCPSRPTASCCA